MRHKPICSTHRDVSTAPKVVKKLRDVLLYEVVFFSLIVGFIGQNSVNAEGNLKRFSSFNRLVAVIDFAVCVFIVSFAIFFADLVNVGFRSAFRQYNTENPLALLCI